MPEPLARTQIPGAWPVDDSRPSLAAAPAPRRVRCRHRERAQGIIEYGLIIALVAVLAIAAFIIFGPALSSLATRLGGSV
jgi:hypothetical protein